MQTVQFAAKFEFLDEIRDFVGKIARESGFGDKDVYNIQLATDEAASNIIEHAYENKSDGVLELSCGVQDDTIKIILTDRGDPFDPSEIPLPDLKAYVSGRKIGGLATVLIGSVVDEVHYESNAGKSNT